MWERLTSDDIALARTQLRIRRAELAQKQAREIGALDSEAAGIAALEELAEAFHRKFRQSAGPSSAPRPAASGARPTAPATAVISGGPTAGLLDPAQQAGPRTNFEVFSHALAKATF